MTDAIWTEADQARAAVAWCNMKIAECDREVEMAKLVAAGCAQFLHGFGASAGPRAIDHTKPPFIQGLRGRYSEADGIAKVEGLK